MTQEQFAEAVGLSGGSHLSRILHATLNAPLDDAERWCSVLKLNGDDARELVLAMHLQNSTQLVRDYVVELRRRADEAEAFRDQCNRRVARARQALDLIDQPSEYQRGIAAPEESGDDSQEGA